MDGAVFTYGKLAIKTNADSRSLDYKTPEINFTFQPYTNSEEKATIQKPSAGFLKLPLYSNVSRENLLCLVDIPTTETADLVLLSGAALIVPDF